MSLKIRSGYAIWTASVLGLMTGCGEGASEGMEPEVTSDVQPPPLPSVGPQGENLQVQAAIYFLSANFEQVYGGKAFGWSCAPTAPEVPLYTTIWRHNGYVWEKVGERWGTTFRADIVSACGGNGAHGFIIPLSNSGPGYYRYKTESLQLIDGQYRSRTADLWFGTTS